MIDLIASDRGTFIGQVATRCYVPSGNGSSTLPFNIRTFHYARDNITSIKIAFANWYVPNGAGPGAAETPVPGTMTWFASIEYPVGVFHQLTFGGATSGTIPTGTTGWSDFTTVFIPNGAMFFVRMYLQGSGGIPYFPGDVPHGNATAGDAVNQSSTNLTLSGTVPDDNDGFYIWPTSIVGRTSKPSLAIWGDSRCVGALDATVDATGEQGEVCRAIGTSLTPGTGGYAYINMGCSADRLANFVASHTLRVALSNYCTTIVCSYPINDLNAGTSVATLQGYLQTVSQYLRPRQFYQITIPPFTTGAWTNPSGSDQTGSGFPANRAAFNAWVRTNGAGTLDGFIEIAGGTEIGGPLSPSGLWHAPGFTSDGLHELTLGNLSMQTINGGFVAPNLIPPGGFGFMPIS